MILVDNKHKYLLIQYKWYIRKDGYVFTRFKNKTIYLHRLITKANKNEDVLKDILKGYPEITWTVWTPNET